MGFFKKREKELSKRPRAELEARYERTEAKLKRAAQAGDLGAVKAAMKEHHTAEYALLHKEFERAKGARRRK